MVTNRALLNRKHIGISALVLIGTVAVSMLLVFPFDMDQFGTNVLVYWGLGGMFIALLLLITSSSDAKASLGVWFAFFIALQHGGGWILQAAFGEQHYSRLVFFTNHTLGKSVALAGTGLLAFSSAYFFYNSWRRKNRRVADCASGIRNAGIDQIPWSLLAILGIGILTFEMFGGINLATGASIVVYVYRSLFGFLAVLIVILLSLKLLSIYAINTSFRLILVLAIWGTYIFLTGRRQDIIPICFATIVLASKWRLINFRLRQWMFVGLFLVSLLAGVAYVRAAYGRNAFVSTIQTEVGSLFTRRASYRGNILSSLKYDLGYRLNAGNVLLGLVAEHPKRELLWFEPLSYSAKKLMPGIVWSSKKDDLQVGELPRLISAHYGLPSPDYIATYITVFYSMGGLPLLVFLSGVFGLSVASLDIKLAGDTRILSVLIAISIAASLLMIDHSIDRLMVNLRNGLILFVIIRLAASFQMSGGSGHHPAVRPFSKF